MSFNVYAKCWGDPVCSFITLCLTTCCLPRMHRQTDGIWAEYIIPLLKLQLQGYNDPRFSDRCRQTIYYTQIRLLLSLSTLCGFMVFSLPLGVGRGLLFLLVSEEGFSSPWCQKRASLPLGVGRGLLFLLVSEEGLDLLLWHSLEVFSLVSYCTKLSHLMRLRQSWFSVNSIFKWACAAIQ